MLANRRLLLLIFAIISVASAVQWWETGIATKIDSSNFDTFVGKDQHVVVEYYAPYCGYCRMMQPEWDKLAEHYMGDNRVRKDVRIAKIDGPADPHLAGRYGINAFPMIVFFKKGEVFPSERFYDQRSFEAFSAWVEKSAGPEESVQNIPSQAENDEETTDVSTYIKKISQEFSKREFSFNEELDAKLKVLENKITEEFDASQIASKKTISELEDKLSHISDQINKLEETVTRLSEENLALRANYKQNIQEDLNERSHSNNELKKSSYQFLNKNMIFQ